MRAVLFVIVGLPIAAAIGYVLYPIYGAAVLSTLAASAIAGAGWQAYFDERRRRRST
jgi:hypothetical protein